MEVFYGHAANKFCTVARASWRSVYLQDTRKDHNVLGHNPFYAHNMTYAARPRLETGAPPSPTSSLGSVNLKPQIPIPKSLKPLTLPRVDLNYTVLERVTTPSWGTLAAMAS